MSASLHGRTHRRTLCAMVQLHCWLPRTTDSVVMPFHSFAILASALASEGINVLGHLADAASAKGTSAKPSGKKSKTSTDPASGANAFAAYLATVAASLSAVPPSAASTVKPTAQKGSSKSITASGSPVSPASTTAKLPAAGLAFDGDAYLRTSRLPIAQSSATAGWSEERFVAGGDGDSENTKSPPTAPAVSARAPVHATPDSIQAARASPRRSRPPPPRPSRRPPPHRMYPRSP